MATHIHRVCLLRDDVASGLPSSWRVLGHELPHLVMRDAVPRTTRTDVTRLRVSLARWAAVDGDPAELDRRLHAAPGPIELQLESGSADDERAALEVLTRAQVFLPRPATDESHADILGRVIELHRRLHDLSKPLVAADYWHAHDTHRWVSRLRPRASLALQIAALFHDVERLWSEPDVRVEQHAEDYQAFKDAHARAGAQMLGEQLTELGLPADLVARSVALVADHERPACSAEAQTLADADALSFFSLNSPGFFDYYGREHTARKVTYTLRRLGPGERWRLSWIKLRADVADVVRELARTEAFP